MPTQKAAYQNSDRLALPENVVYFPKKLLIAAPNSMLSPTAPNRLGPAGGLRKAKMSGTPTNTRTISQCQIEKLPMGIPTIRRARIAAVVLNESRFS